MQAEETMASSSDSSSSTEQRKGFEFNGKTYPTYNEMVAAKRHRNQTFLEQKLLEIASSAEKSSVSSLESDASSASSGPKQKRRRPRDPGERNMAPLRRNPRRSTSANASYSENDDGSLGSSSLSSSSSSSSYSSKSDSSPNSSGEASVARDIHKKIRGRPPGEGKLAPFRDNRRRSKAPDSEDSSSIGSRSSSASSYSSNLPKNKREIESLGDEIAAPVSKRARKNRPSRDSERPEHLMIPRPTSIAKQINAPPNLLRLGIPKKSSRSRGADAKNLLPISEIKDMSAILEHIVLNGFQAKNRELAWRDFLATSSNENILENIDDSKVEVEISLKQSAVYSTDRRLYSTILDGGHASISTCNERKLMPSEITGDAESDDDLIPKEYLLSNESEDMEIGNSKDIDQLWIEEFGDGLDPSMFADKNLSTKYGEDGKYTSTLLQRCWERAVHAASSSVTLNLNKNRSDSSDGNRHETDTNPLSHNHKTFVASDFHDEAIHVVNNVMDLLLSEKSGLITMAPNEAGVRKIIQWQDICKCLQSLVMSAKGNTENQSTQQSSLDFQSNSDVRPIPSLNEVTVKAITMRLIERYGAF